MHSNERLLTCISSPVNTISSPVNTISTTTPATHLNPVATNPQRPPGSARPAIPPSAPPPHQTDLNPPTPPDNSAPHTQPSTQPAATRIHGSCTAPCLPRCSPGTRSAAAPRSRSRATAWSSSALAVQLEDRYLDCGAALVSDALPGVVCRSNSRT
ncbi:uncharacterized protein M421DRAFT_405283 [Didymella exigua CBS 183.55]|uniref:Uncharacterized protein n=1 Tax=Didymella exigua CBS 183.55 TaxID=1150837 RepID=A0A6A5R9I8_9PLEO|nr:uncharacterized protein M421DRAFT_405283 [Didymella exigua CBS 183.55]KAF1923674.1 hypothetical protein M421DRAFT_405283 [Didymella exigua CBS 183.55]